jgi:hypothetical protein
MSKFIALYDHNSNGLWWSGEASTFSDAVRQLAANTGTGFNDDGDDKSIEVFAEGFWGVEITAEQSAILEDDRYALEWGTEDRIRDASYVPGDEEATDDEAPEAFTVQIDGRSATFSPVDYEAGDQNVNWYVTGHRWSHAQREEDESMTYGRGSIMCHIDDPQSEIVRAFEQQDEMSYAN